MIVKHLFSEVPQTGDGYYNNQSSRLLQSMVTWLLSLDIGLTVVDSSYAQGSNNEIVNSTVIFSVAGVAGCYLYITITGNSRLSTQDNVEAHFGWTRQDECASVSNISGQYKHIYSYLRYQSTGYTALRCALCICIMADNDFNISVGSYTNENVSFTAFTSETVGKFKVNSIDGTEASVAQVSSNLYFPAMDRAYRIISGNNGKSLLSSEYIMMSNAWLQPNDDTYWGGIQFKNIYGKCSSEIANGDIVQIGTKLYIAYGLYLYELKPDT